jgi:hypothetical protein
MFSLVFRADARKGTVNPAVVRRGSRRVERVREQLLLILEPVRRYQQASSLCARQMTGQLRLCTAQEPVVVGDVLFAGSRDGSGL